MLYFVKGEASVGLGGDVQNAQAGTWVHMPANLKHSINGKTPVVMLLVLLKWRQEGKQQKKGNDHAHQAHHRPGSSRLPW
jgi:quercetin dioxygenase-like cupin family protein